jgi:hypothetical protein
MHNVVCPSGEGSRLSTASLRGGLFFSRFFPCETTQHLRGSNLQRPFGEKLSLFHNIPDTDFLLETEIQKFSNQKLFFPLGKEQLVPYNYYADGRDEA